jgi:hypothetical protein
MTDPNARTPQQSSDGSRLSRVDWSSLERDLNAFGNGVISQLLSKSECVAMASMYEDVERFRKTVVMARHNFGRGEYRYFDYPLPHTVQQMREAFYSRLAPIANRWNSAMGIERVYPDRLTEYLNSCAAVGQTQATPLLLRYAADDYNCLHQDLYGESIFPLQLAVQLNDPNTDFEGGEFVMTEQRPRMQSRAEVIALQQGDAVIFPVHNRPVKGSRGYYRVNMRHGVSRVRSGNRNTLGIIFHDAK